MASNEVRIILRAIDEYSKVFKKLHKDLASMGAAMRLFDPLGKTFINTAEQLRVFQNSLQATRKAEESSRIKQAEIQQRIALQKQLFQEELKAFKAEEAIIRASKQEAAQIILRENQQRVVLQQALSQEEQKIARANQQALLNASKATAQAEKDAAQLSIRNSREVTKAKLAETKQ